MPRESTIRIHINLLAKIRFLAKRNNRTVAAQAEAMLQFYISQCSETLRAELGKVKP